MSESYRIREVLKACVKDDKLTDNARWDGHLCCK